MTQQQEPTAVNSLDDLFAEETVQEVVQQQVEPTTIIPTLFDDITEEKEQPEVIVETPKAVDKTNYSKKINTLLETGFVDNFEITVDGETVFLSDLQINDEDTYNTLLSQIKSEKDKQLKEKYISKEGIDETTEKLIEIRRAGGDIKEILRENVQAIDLLTNYKQILDGGEEQEKENLAIDILAQELKNKGLEDEVIEAQIKVYIKKGELEDRANQLLDNHIGFHKEELENKKNTEIEKQNKEKEAYKNFKKSLSGTYKQLSIPEKTERFLVENATKLDEYSLSNTDKVYFDLRNKNLELFSKVNYYINDPEGFEKWISGKEVTKAKKAEILKSAITINTGKTKPISKRADELLDDIFDE